MRNLFIVCLFALTACNEQNKNSEKALETPTASSKPAFENTVLTVTPLDVAGEPGKVTFSQNEKTVFYFDNNAKKGEIVLNNIKHVLDRYDFDSKNETYSLSNSEVRIVTGPCKFRQNEGSDCFYGRAAEVTISAKEATLTLQDVDVQDCQSN